MTQKFKFKTNYTVYQDDIPYGTECLELDCKKIGKNAFANRKDLRSVTLINTEVIGEDAFRGCRALQEIRLPDTLREIKDFAFWNTDIRYLSIPKSVTRLGKLIVCNGNLAILCEYEERLAKSCTVEVYLKDETFPFFPGCWPGDKNSILVARSPETDEVLLRFVMLGTPDMVFPGNGIDFTEYDNIFKDREFNHYNDLLMLLQAAEMRLDFPVGMSADTLLFFRNYVSDKYKSLFYFSEAYLTDDLDEFPYLDKINNKDLMEIIDRCARFGLTELTAVLMQKLHERGGGNMPDLEL